MNLQRNHDVVVSQKVLLTGGLSFHMHPDHLSRPHRVLFPFRLMRLGFDDDMSHLDLIKLLLKLSFGLGVLGADNVLEVMCV